MEGAIDTEVIAIGVGVAPIIALLINPAKRWIPSDFMVYIAIGVALSWTIVYHWSVNELARENIMATIMLGIVTGLAAAGSHNIGSTVIEKVRNGG